MSNIESLQRNFELQYGHPPQYFMKMAQAEMYHASELGYPPFTVIVVNGKGELIHTDHDRVKDLGPHAHAEINALGAIWEKYNHTIPSGLAFITSSEPCPPCLGTMIRARVSTIVFGARTESTAYDPAFLAEEIVGRANRKPILIADIMSQEMTTSRTELLAKLAK